MFIRILSGIIGLVVLVPLMIIGGVWLQIALMAIIVIAMWELYRAFGDVKSVHFLALAAAIAYVAFIRADIALQIVPIVAVPILLIVGYMSFGTLHRKSYNPNGTTIAIFGFFYIAVMLSTVFLVRESIGAFEVWLIFISAWGCDTGAYFSGYLFGRNKLAPTLSPKKTVEGSIGGTVIATALAAAYGFVLYSMDLRSFGHILVFALVAFVCSIAGQLGDLVASAIKRSRSIKDFGNIMPGHGGALDRFDSIIFVAPLAFVILYFLGSGGIML